MINNSALGYVRVSSIDQIKGSSISVQKDHIVTYSKLMGLKIRTIYCDAGVSGTTPLSKRPQGGLLLNELKNQQTNLIIYSPDRLFRSQSICHELPPTIIHFAKEGLGFSKDRGHTSLIAAESCLQNLEFIFKAEFGQEFKDTMDSMLNSEVFFDELISSFKSNGCQININDVLGLIRKVAQDGCVGVCKGVN